jgi:pimeloyl-ACP methyl ester carboxylesterase
MPPVRCSRIESAARGRGTIQPAVLGVFAVTQALQDEAFSDDIMVPAADGYPLAATLFLPRGPKRHAVLINAATATPRKIYRGFAGYLARRGCAVLTYDYRGIGGSRQKDVVGYDRPKSLVGFKASMADWAALDVTATVAWMRERYHALPLSYVGHSFGGQALGLLANDAEVSRALLIASQAATWKLMARPERYRVYALMRGLGVPLTRVLGYAPGWAWIGEDLPMRGDMDCFAEPVIGPRFAQTRWLAMTAKSGSHPPLSCHAHAGHPVRRGLSIQSLMSLECWIVRSSRTMTVEIAAAFPHHCRHAGR